MTILVRWRPRTLAEYEMYERTTKRWVPIEREDVDLMRLAGECIHMNPRAGAEVELAPIQKAKPERRRR